MFWRLQFPLLVSFIVGFLTIVMFFFQDPTERLEEATGFSKFTGSVVHALKGSVDTIQEYMIIVAGFALLLGVVNVVQNNVRKIERKDKGWPYAITLLVGLFVMGIIGVLGALPVTMGGLTDGITTQADGSPTAFQWLTDAFFRPLQATMFSLLAFYIASAAFRAFRVRNTEATLLLLAAVIVMLGRIPVGEYLFSWIDGGERWVPELTEWLMAFPNSAAQRGIIIGAALGAASLSLRVILGIERSYLGLEKNQ